jgi:hypothetical protein
MIFLCFFFHPLLSCATFFSAYLFFYTPEDPNLLRFSLLLLLLYVVCVQSNSISSFYLNFYWLLFGNSPQHFVTSSHPVSLIPVLILSLTYAYVLQKSHHFGFMTISVHPNIPVHGTQSDRASKHPCARYAVRSCIQTSLCALRSPIVHPNIPVRATQPDRASKHPCARYAVRSVSFSPVC